MIFHTSLSRYCSWIYLLNDYIKRHYGYNSFSLTRFYSLKELYNKQNKDKRSYYKRNNLITPIIKNILKDIWWYLIIKKIEVLLKYLSIFVKNTGLILKYQNETIPDIH